MSSSDTFSQMRCAWQRSTQISTRGGYRRGCCKEGARVIRHQENKRAVYRMNGKFRHSADFQSWWVTPTDINWAPTWYKGCTWDSFPSSIQTQAAQTQGPWVRISFHLIPAELRSLLAPCRSPAKYTGVYEEGQLVVNLITCQKMWVAGQTPLLRSHSENTEIQAVAWHLTKECLDCVLVMRSLPFWAALHLGSQHDITSYRNHKQIHAQTPRIPFGGGK